MTTTSSKQILIKGPVKSILKFGFIFHGLLVLLGVAVLFTTLFIVKISHPVFYIVMSAIGIFFFAVGMRYLDNAFYKEKLIIDPDTITLVYKKLGREKRHEFKLKDITHFGFAGARQYTRHPMDNDVVDFTGLGTSERELQYLIDDGTMEIVTGEKNIRFGKNIPSWDAEEIVKEVEAHLGVIFENRYQSELPAEADSEESKATE